MKIQNISKKEIEIFRKKQFKQLQKGAIKLATKLKQKEIRKKIKKLTGDDPEDIFVLLNFKHKLNRLDN